MANVTIYSTPTCPYCKMAKEYLTKHHIVYKNIDVSEDTVKAEEMIKKSGQMGVPVIDVHGTIITGFDEKQLGKALGLS